MKLALGTAQFGLRYGVANRRGNIPGDEAEAILGYAAAAGINTLDTAVGYGDSERRLGEIGVDGWQVISKLPEVPADCTDVGVWMTDVVSASLRRLKLPRLYGLLLHRPNQLLEPRGDEIFRGLRDLRERGLISHFGISIHVPDQLDALWGRYQFEIVQAPLNLFDDRLRASGWLARLKGSGVKVHVRSIFLQGLLLMGSAERSRRFGRWDTLWRAYESWLEERELSPLQACVAHAVSMPAIDKVIVGVESRDQLEQIVSAAATAAAVAFPENFVGANDADVLDPLVWMNW